MIYVVSKCLAIKLVRIWFQCSRNNLEYEFWQPSWAYFIYSPSHGIPIWLFAFQPNESDGTKFVQWILVSEELTRRKWLFFGFWHFRPFFKRLWHPSKWSLCLQKFWILLIYYVMRLQHNLHAHGKSPKRKTKGGGGISFPRYCILFRSVC